MMRSVDERWLARLSHPRGSRLRASEVGSALLMWCRWADVCKHVSRRACCSRAEALEVRSKGGISARARLMGRARRSALQLEGNAVREVIWVVYGALRGGRVP
eukprot:7128850-Pyramimonas_sp.AAC.1